MSPILAEDAEAYLHGRDNLLMPRELNAELLASDGWVRCVLPVGDGIGVAARR